MQVDNVKIISIDRKKCSHLNEPSFLRHNIKNRHSEYRTKDKCIIAGMSALGVVASLAILAKCHGHSLNPKKVKSIHNSYFMNAKFEEADIIAMGAGSCLGGLVGGCLIDKNKTNRKLKKREAVMQIGNVSIPILTVGAFSRLGKKLGKVPQAIGAIAGLFTGVFLSNILMNHLSDAIFHTNKSRKVKLSDFSAHIDDMLMAASFMTDKADSVDISNLTKSPSGIIHLIARVIPFALIVAGYETGKQHEK